jgi:hypothetical protein
MKYSLSNVLLLFTLVAVLLGWFYDHRRLEIEKEYLNAEAANLFGRITASHGSGRVLMPGETADRRAYNFLIQEDRAEFLKRLCAPSL